MTLNYGINVYDKYIYITKTRKTLKLNCLEILYLIGIHLKLKFYKLKASFKKFNCFRSRKVKQTKKKKTNVFILF